MKLSKPTTIILLLTLFLILLFLATVFGLSYSRLFYCTVTFDTDYGTAIEPLVVRYGNSLTEIPFTEREYNTFGGWYYDEEHTLPYQGEPVEGDTTLYIKWDTIFNSDYFQTLYGKLQACYAGELSLFLFEDEESVAPFYEVMELDDYQNKSTAHIIGGIDAEGHDTIILALFVFDDLGDARDLYQKMIVQEEKGKPLLGDIEFLGKDALMGGVACGIANTILGEIGSDNNFYYAVNEEQTEATVLRYKNNADTVVLPETYLGIPVTTIGPYAFYRKNLTDVILHDGIQNFGTYSFAFCNNLAALDIPAGVEMLANGLVAESPHVTLGLDNLVSNEKFAVLDNALIDQEMGRLILYLGNAEMYSVPESIEIIAEYAFAHKRTLNKIVLPEGVEYICKYAFYDTGIENLSLPQSIESIEEGAFQGAQDGTSPLRSIDFAINTMLRNMSVNAFADNPLIESFVFPKNLHRVDFGILKNCTNLRTVVFETGIQIDGIYNETFLNCVHLEEISLPDSVTYVGATAFAGCNSLQSINLNRATAIENSAFSACPMLEIVVFHKDSELIDLFDKTFYHCENLSVVELPDALCTIGAEVFAGCTSLASIDIKNTKELSNDAFTGCSNLQTIELKAVETIGPSAFANCVSLQSVDLTGAKSVGGAAFANCVNLTTVLFSEMLEELGVDALDHCDAIKKLSLPSAAIKGGFTIGNLGGLEELISPIIKDTNGMYIPVTRIFQNSQAPDSLQIIRISNPITTIPDRYFAELTNIRQIEIPDSVEFIEEWAFYGCVSLSVFAVPPSLKEIGASAFCGCIGLSEFPMPDGLVSIGESAFAGDSSLVIRGFPNSLKRLESGAFRNCVLVTEVALPNGMEYVGNGAFAGCYGIETMQVPLAPYAKEDPKYPHSIQLYTDTYLGDYVCNVKSVRLTSDTRIVPERAFAELDSIETILFPDTVERFEDYSLNGIRNVKKLDISMTKNYGRQIFADCPMLEEITVQLESVYDRNTPSYFAYFFATSVGIVFPHEYESIKKVTVKGNNTTLANRAFAEIQNLEEVVLPSTLTTISEKLFENCQNLTTVILPQGVTEISNYAFAGCASLTEIELPSSVSMLDDGAFCRASSLQTVLIPQDSLLSIVSDSIFADCVALTNINIPDSVWEIPNHMFQNCVSLTTIELPSRLQYIRSGAFRGAGLTNITIPHTVIEIDWYAFTDCIHIEEVVFEQIGSGIARSSRLVTIGRGAFMNCGQIEKIVLPASLNSIVGEAFKNCVRLEEVYILHEYDHTKGEKEWNTNGTSL
ncbi:MAG: leucine-rich repeat protein, partial [Clostridia bacterium]|nr:leucine-rich repeat protein [Clostridia bacterium]